MHVVIMGSGRTGSRLASMLDEAGHDVSVIDWSESAFDRLGEEFRGRTILGNAIDADVLREAGVERADVFVAATSGDNRNIMASEVVREEFRVPRVVCRVKDPNRASIFSQMGIHVDCRTSAGADAILNLLGLLEPVSA